MANVPLLYSRQCVIIGSSACSERVEAVNSVSTYLIFVIFFTRATRGYRMNLFLSFYFLKYFWPTKYRPKFTQLM